MNHTLISLFLMFSLFGCQQNTHDIIEIQEVMQKQADAWNKGDIEGYMQAYWNSEELTFVTKRSITKGWNSTLKKYISSYKGPDSMGKLSFEVIKQEPLGSQAYSMVGKYTIKMSSGNTLTGHFTLLWKKINGSWVIVQDHSS